MSSDFQELDYQQTPLGELILRKRRSLSAGQLVYEVKLDGAFLMSSLINEAEKALATLTLRQLVGQPCDVLVGGLGLGHTAEAALRFDHVRHLDVVEHLEPVIDWHRRRLVPAADALMDDRRCRLVHDDFFDLVAGREATVFRRYEAILLDIDHSPDSVLHPRHAAFYTVPGLTRLTTHLKPPGLFALWSADRPEDTFLRALREVFVCVEAHDVRFFNHHLGEHDSNWVVIARLSDEASNQDVRPRHMLSNDRTPAMNDAQRRNRVRGTMLGAAIGDALGAPLEGASFVDRNEIDQRLKQPGQMQWTDDAHMTIGMAESLIACRGFDGAHLVEHFAQRHQQEPWRGYGPGPPQVFAALRHGARWDKAGRTLFNGSGSFGNGATMRIAPAALFAYPDLHEVAVLARKTAVITHAHEWGIEGAVVQAVALAWLLQQSAGDTLQRGPLLKVLHNHVRSEQFHQAINNLAALSPDAAPSGVVSHLGNSIEALGSAPMALFVFLRSPNDFAEVVRFAISLGGDTDTIASMAGALAGAFLGEAAIPAAWREQVEQSAHLAELGERLLEAGHQVRFAG